MSIENLCKFIIYLQWRQQTCECIFRYIGIGYHVVISPNFKTVLMKHPVEG